jgi:hypothetical protein
MENDERPKPKQALPSLNSLFLPQFFQLVKTGSALSDVREQVSELSVRRLLGEFQQDFSSRASDALRIGKVFVHDPVKCVEQFFFRIHCAHPG